MLSGCLRRWLLVVSWAGCLWLALPAGAAPSNPSNYDAGDVPAVPVAPAASNTMGQVLQRYQVALDQLAAGHALEARVVLEDSIRRYGSKPETNLLLAYLLQREDRSAEARDRLAEVAPVSPLAAEYFAQMERGSALRASAAGASPGAGYGPAAAPGKTVASLAQGDARLLKLEQILAGLVNIERGKAGLPDLTYDEKLADVARAHSVDMRDRSYFAHESPTASLREPLDRYRAVFNTTPAVVAENVYRAWGSRHQLSEKDVSEAHTALMNSPGHRANIMFPDVTRIGIGIVVNSTGDIWIDEMFSRR